MTTTANFSSTAQCIDVLEGLQTLASGSVACTVTSPPYNIGIKYSTHQDSESQSKPIYPDAASVLKFRDER